MIGSNLGPIICQKDLCRSIKEHIASFLPEPSMTNVESDEIPLKYQFLDIYEGYCFEGEFRKYVERRNNPEESLQEDYSQIEDDDDIPSNEFNHQIKEVYQRRLQYLLKKEGF